MNTSTSETTRLDGIAEEAAYAFGANETSIRYRARLLARHWRGSRCLELGPAEGIMTPYLAAAFDKLTLVDGAAKFCADLRERFPDAEVVHSLFEDFEPKGRFDTIILGHVLEHVIDPTQLLIRAKKWLSERGCICATVPNARSLHRQAAVDMGILETEHTLNETDRRLGHRRVFDPETLRSTIRKSGLHVEATGGYWLKPLSNAQIEASWTPEMLNAFMSLGERYPDLAAEIFAVATANQGSVQTRGSES